jgi:hypothetical protein
MQCLRQEIPFSKIPSPVSNPVMYCRFSMNLYTKTDTALGRHRNGDRITGGVSSQHLQDSVWCMYLGFSFVSYHSLQGTLNVTSRWSQIYSQGMAVKEICHVGVYRATVTNIYILKRNYITSVLQEYAICNTEGFPAFRQTLQLPSSALRVVSSFGQFQKSFWQWAVITRPLSTHGTTQTQNVGIHRHPCLWVGFEPTIPAFERAKTVHALDRVATVIWINP